MCLIFTSWVLDGTVAGDELLVLAVLRGALSAVARLGSVPDDLGSADLGEGVLLATTPLLLLHHIRNLRHLSVV